MKKLKTKIIVLVILLFALGCKKSGIAESNEEQTIEQIAKEFNFSLADISQVKERILKMYGTPKKWKEKILEVRAKKKTKASTNRTTTSFKLTVEYWGYNFQFENVPDDVTIKDYLETVGFSTYQLSCDNAGCSPTCIGKLLSGLLDQSSQSFLNDCELEGGYFLPCVSYCLSDCRIKFADDMYPTPMTGGNSYCASDDDYDYGPDVAHSDVNWKVMDKPNDPDDWGVRSSEYFKGKRKATEPQGGHFVWIKHYTSVCSFCNMSNPYNNWYEELNEVKIITPQLTSSRVKGHLNYNGATKYADETKTFTFSEIF
jgi:ferredoxin